MLEPVYRKCFVIESASIWNLHGSNNITIQYFEHRYCKAGIIISVGDKNFIEINKELDILYGELIILSKEMQEKLKLKTVPNR